MEHISLSLLFSIFKFLLSPFTKSLKWIYNKLPFKVVGKKNNPKLGIIESSWRDHMWDYGKQGDKEVVVIYTYWQITNTLPYNLTAINVFLAKPERVKGRVLIKHYNSDIWGSYSIPKGYTTEIDASFVIDKEYAKNPQDVIKAKIEIQDAVGRIYKIDNIEIHPVKKISVKKENLIIEDPSKITNDVEKQVVSVLKNEVQQYKVRGRREGRLGTVEWPTGTLEWRKADSKIQFLFESSNKENVSSEHVVALLALFKNSSKKEQQEIIQALLNRIDKKSEYRDIGYLMIFFLFEIDRLSVGLDTALQKLKGDKANGFSDVLRMLDILLAFRYQEFEEAELNGIEKFAYSTKEHPFNIKERVNAIRVRTMAQ